MTDENDNWLLSERLRGLTAQLQEAVDDAAREAIWAKADAALAAADAEEDAELAIPLWDRDRPALEALLAAWDDGSRPLPEWDKAVLKRAFKAYKKRLKLMRLDDESTAGANPLSAGRSSSIVGIRPPATYGAEVWEMLVRQGKLKDSGDGLLEPGTS